MAGFDIDHAIVSRMQADCLHGLSVSEIVANLRNSLRGRGTSTLVVLKYFMVAFGLSLQDARQLEATPILGGSAMSDSDANTLLRPKMLNFLESIHPYK